MIFGIKLVYFTRFLRVKNYPGAKSYPKLLQSSLKVTEALLTLISVVCAANPICCVIKSDGSNQWHWPDPQTVQLCGQRHNCQYHCRRTIDGGRRRFQLQLVCIQSNPSEIKKIPLYIQKSWEAITGKNQLIFGHGPKQACLAGCRCRPF